MSDLLLQGYRVLVVEDEYLLADELRHELKGAGAEVIGPFGNLPLALASALEENGIDAAILDLNLGGTEVSPLADLLISQGVPIVFLTGYDAGILPARFANLPFCLKPSTPSAVVVALKVAIETGAHR